MADKVVKIGIALFQSEYGGICPHDAEKGYAAEKDTYVRVSEIVEVEFPPADRTEVITGMVKQLDEKINSVRANAEREVTELTRKRNDLLALPSE